MRNVAALPIIRECRPVGEPQPLTTIGNGPGSELARILHSLNFTPEACVGCNSHMHEMDYWSTAGCREHFDEIVGWLRESYDRLGWGAKLKAAAAAVGAGLALQIDPRDPSRSLVELAIQRAEEKVN